MRNYDYLFKYIIIGDSGVGKSCLLLAYTDGRFKESHETTIGVEFGSKTFQMGNKSVKVQIWDTAGQESFSSITRSYYRGAVACILTYDITRRNSFDHLVRWYKDVVSFGSSEARITLVGNKIDLEGKRVVSTTEGYNFATEHNMDFLEVSAKQAINVDEIFNVTTRNVLEGIRTGSIDVSNQVNGIQLGSGKNKHTSMDIASDTTQSTSSCC